MIVNSDRRNLILAFDVYGTLFQIKIPDIPEHIMNEWRQKQLEFTWRLALMEKWLDFDEVTKIAFKYICEKNNLNFNDSILEEWLMLKPFDDVSELKSLCESYDLFILSNGTYKSIQALLKNSNILDLFKKIYSVEEVRTYKPSPKVYKDFMNKHGNSYLISSNAWDLAGAKNVGMKAIYLNRYNIPLDTLSQKPDT